MPVRSLRVIWRASGVSSRTFGEHGHGVELVVEDVDDVPHAAEGVQASGEVAVEAEEIAEHADAQRAASARAACCLPRGRRVRRAGRRDATHARGSAPPPPEAAAAVPNVGDGRHADSQASFVIM